MRVLFSICHHCAVAFPAGSCPECGVLPSATICMNCGLTWKKTEYVEKPLDGSIPQYNPKWAWPEPLPNHPYICQEAPMPPVGVWTPDFTGQQPYEPEKPLDGSITIPNQKWGWPVPQEIDFDDEVIDLLGNFDDGLGLPRQDVFFTDEETALPSARWCIKWRYKRKVFEQMLLGKNQNPDELELLPPNQNRVHHVYYNLASYKKASALVISLRLQFPEKVFTVERVQ